MKKNKILNSLASKCLARAILPCFTSATLCLSAASYGQDCGFSINHGVYASWPDAYHGWVELQNNSPVVATAFSLYLQLEGAAVNDIYQANITSADEAFWVTEPSWLQWQTIPPSGAFRFHFQAEGENQGIQPYLTSINGEACDLTPPAVSLHPKQTFFSSKAQLELEADSIDDVAVVKVVFQHNGKVIAVDNKAPFTAELSIDATLNGRQYFTATAYDPSGNSASEQTSVFVAIGNKFFGGALDRDIEYENFPELFNQVTPGNAGKWGSVESNRDEMNWQALDKAYQYSKDRHLLFKMHTLLWGQQQPAWINALPAAEQLAEIEQWMAAVAARYSDIDMVDVLNEPLHAPPTYREALGGAGETGWDWVINAFQLARKHFPQSELILNDYNILIFNQFTTDYLEIILLLQERGLIDGIGVQAHFLERADISEVSRNLDTLAATGLPIYVSELDVNFSDDARQAQHLRDLMTVFWEQPSVVGVTHWGFLEGAVWREDSFLVRNNGEDRPAMTWLRCYLAGNTECPVPEYIPQARIGDISGLTLEAEDYDEAEGVLALGNIIAYVDQGDRAVYKRVQFDSHWDSFEITYSKGNDLPGGVEVYIDQVDASPEAVLTLNNSGGWGTSATVSVPWLPLEGEHEVIVLFTENYGVGNIDSMRFSAPESAARNLIANGTFENGSDGWFTWSGSLTASSARARSGSQSLLHSQRTSNSSPAAISLTSLLSPGESYEVSFWVSIDGAASAQANLTSKLQCEGEDASYSWLASPTLVTNGEWVELAGTLAAPDCPLSDALLYVEGPEAGVEVYIDDAQVLAPRVDNLLNNGDFEQSSTSGWTTWDGILSIANDFAYSGEQSLKLSARSGNGPAAAILGSSVMPASNYDVSFWVAIDGANEASVNLTQKIQCAGEAASYSWLVPPVSVIAGEWQQLSATLQVPDCDIADLLVYVEGPAGGIDIYVDNVVISPQ